MEVCWWCFLSVLVLSFYNKVHFFPPWAIQNLPGKDVCHIHRFRILLFIYFAQSADVTFCDLLFAEARAPPVDKPASPKKGSKSSDACVYPGLVNLHLQLKKHTHMWICIIQAYVTGQNSWDHHMLGKVWFTAEVKVLKCKESYLKCSDTLQRCS